MFDILENYRMYIQTEAKPMALAGEIPDKVRDDVDDFDVFYDSGWNCNCLEQRHVEVIDWIADNSATSSDTAISADEALEMSSPNALIVYLNNLYI